MQKGHITVVGVVVVVVVAAVLLLSSSSTSKRISKKTSYRCSFYRFGVSFLFLFRYP